MTMVDGSAVTGIEASERGGGKSSRVDALRRRLSLAPVTIFAAGAILVGVLAYLGNRAAWVTDQIRFELAANDLIARVTDRLTTQITLLDGLGALHNVSPNDFDAGRFRAYVRELALQKRYPGLGAIGFVRRTRAQDQDEVAARVSSMYGGPVSINPRIATGEGFPITLLENADGRPRAALGFEASSEASRRAAMERARDTAEPAATGRVQLYSPVGGSRQTGFVVFRPVYTRGLPPEDVESRRRRLVGFTYAAYSNVEFFRAALDASLLRFMSVEVLDGPLEDGASAPLFQSDPAPVGGRHAVTLPLTVAGHTFVVRMISRPSFDIGGAARLVLPLAGLGLLLVLAAAALVRQGLVARIAEEEERIREQQAARDKDFLLQEMKHRIKNAFARVQAVARQTARNSTSMSEFVTAFEARLAAMSATHDLLTRSRWESADLQDLIVAEIEPVLGAVGETIIVKGPPVRLDARRVLSLGLTLHELATNAVKYSGVSRPGGSLEVRWRITGPAAARTVVLDWVERGDEVAGRPTPDSEHRGFGTKLIETTVTRELGGHFERRFEPSGHVCRLTFPIDA